VAEETWSVSVLGDRRTELASLPLLTDVLDGIEAMAASRKQNVAISVSIFPRLHPGRSYPKYKPWDERVDDFVVPGIGLAFLGDGLCQFGVHIGASRTGRRILPGAREGHNRRKAQA
jgi:hypothetical protein